MDSSELPNNAHVVGHQGAQVEIDQRRASAVTGWLGVLVIAACIAGIVLTANNKRDLLWLPIVILALVVSSLVVVAPGQSSVIQFFGRYIGTVSRPGFWWVAPLTVRRGVSLRVRNFETAHLKVNDADGSPVEIAAIVVWQVADTAKATYAVDNYQGFVSMQAESALRHVATSHPYDEPTGAGTSLRGSTEQVVADLARELAERVHIAGVEIVEVRISHLAYAQEIAQAMLRRQQAGAVIAARTRIVEGAVGMVHLALERLADSGVVALDEERTASMVSNLMVVLCADQPPSPVVNTGTLYT
ncbi:band 7 protein [Mycobacterium sp. 852002-51971_SCH5477799-a]|uniref:SPFH domain-containing protein n=1 Tax=Mycobacterium sp. 852002-51971_SCH5477799-a TaxID=1834106 RepID=UPI0007FDEDDE|nr:SPFH domain-containing protein [Mycobacterium sp. 852002-51971_SCH5477799-a]OBF63376.1 band 7 protein [Mycobacterium sp. 852002-51971_SCH5477799-a]